MPNRPVEDILRKRLRQHPTPVDTDALWAKVEPRLPRKRPTVPPWIWVLAGAALLCGLYLFLPQLPEERIESAVTPRPVVVDVAPPTSPAPAPAPAETSALTATEKPLPGPATNTYTPAAKVRNVTPGRSATAATARPLAGADLSVQPSRLPTIDHPEIATGAAAGKAKATARTPPAIPLLTPTPLIPVHQYFTFSPPEAVVPASPQAQNNKPKQIRVKKPAFWTVEPGIALSLPGRSVAAADGSPNDGQAGINNRYEKGLEGVTVQALVGYHRPNGLSLRTGIAYSRINSRVESEHTTTGTESVQAIVAIIESPNGSRSEQTGTVRVANETTTTQRYYNSVRSIDVPLLAGYRFSGTKWGLTVEAGPTFNLGSTGNAHLYDGTGSYRSVDAGHFRKKLIGQGFLANFGGAYNLSEKTMLVVNLRIQGFGKGGFEAPAAGYETRYTLFGVQFGYRARF